jgi:hypothetical protein
LSPPYQCPDRIFINSLPKSGTHLLAKTVELFGYREHFDDGSVLDDPSRVAPIFINYREVRDALAREGKQPESSADASVAVGTLTPLYVDATTFGRWLGSLSPRRYILGHVMYSPALRSLLSEHSYRHLFILRDPRAVVVSLLDFILETRGMPRPHFLREDFLAMSKEARLAFILEGGAAPRAGITTQSFAAVYRGLLAWEADSSCLVVRFEDLIGPQGGGSLERQRATVERIAAHLGRPFGEVAERFSAVFDSSSRTFRTGQIDGWQAELDPASLAYLNSCCAPLCQSAGYAG